ncbi:mucin-2-like isoform X1 [Dermacentor albipictus]|uniref:mucin-2-like isoform X1 n=2 Tax=Dermacentor albipictus TaxID=60249 RepID=UPI0038FD3B27
MFNPGTFAMDDGGRCLLDVINDPLLLQSFLEDKNEEVSKELSSLESVLLGRDEVSSTTSCLPARCELPDSMGYGCSGTDKPVAAALAVSATSTAAPSDVSAASPQLLVSSTVPPAPPLPAATAAASNGLPGASPHSTRSSPASSRPHSASPLPAAPIPVSWSSPSPIAVSRSQSLSSSSASTPATTKATATVAPLPVAPQQAPPSRPNVGQAVSGSPSPRTAGAPRLIQPKQPQILPKLSSGSANMTTPAATATTRSQSPRAAQHKATPQPAPVPAPQPATTVQRGAAMGLNTGSPLLIGNPGAAQAGMFQAGAAQGTFLLNQYIPGLGQSPILIQGSLGQIQGSLGQIQGVQLALRPPHATGLSLGPQAGHKPHGGHPGQPGTPTLVIPQNLGPRPNFILAPRMVSSPLSFAIAPGQPLTLQQLQAMLPAQTMLAQPTLGAFQTDQHQSLVQIPTFTQPQILAHDHHHHHHHHHHGALSAPLISTGGTMVSSAPAANLVTHHPVMTTTTVLHPAPPQPAPVPVSAPMTSATIQQQPQARTTASPATEKPVKAPTVNLAELLKEHGIMPESTPPPSPTSNQDSTISVDVPVTPAPVTENVQVVVSKSPQTVAVSPQQRVQLSLAHDGSVVLHPHGSNLSTMPAPVQSPGLVATTVTPTSTSAPGVTALSRTHSALLERLSAAPPVSVPDLASLTAPRVSVSAPTMVAAPSLVAPSVMTPSMMAATTHPHQLTLHTVNNGLVPTQQLGQPQSFVTLHGTAVANMLCHGNNARINHIVVSPSPSLGHQQQHHHHQHALHHTCHAVANTAVVSSVASAVVPTTTTVMAASPTMVGRTAVPTSMPHTVVTVAACPSVTTVTVTPTVVVTSNSGATAHTSGKCTAPMNSQNQQLYEQLQSQITYLNSLKKPTMQQKLLLQQMLSIEEKLRDSNKPQVSSSSNDTTTTAAAVPTSHAHCMQRHEVKPTVVSHPIPAAATIITAKSSAVTTVQVPTITVATTTRTNSRTSHHKVNHADVKPKASILHAGNTASIITTQKAITSHSGPVRIIATAPTTTSAACASSTCSSTPCSSASVLSVPLASASPLLSSPSVATVSSASLVSSVPLVSAAPLASSGPMLSTASLASSSITPVSSAPLVPSLPVASSAPLVPSIPPVSTAPALAQNIPMVSCSPSAPVPPLVSNMPVVSSNLPTPTAPLASMPAVSCVSSAPSLSSNTLVVSCAPSSHTAPQVPNMPVVSSCIPSAHTAPMVSKMPVVSCASSVPSAPLVSSKPLVSCLPPVSTSALVSSIPQVSAAVSVSSVPHISGTLLVSTAALMSSPSLLASSTPLMSSAPLVSTAHLVSSAPLMSTASLMSTTPMASTAPMVSYASLVSSAPVVSTAPIMAPSTTDMTVPSMASHPVVTVASHIRVPNQASAKFVPQLHHAVHHHHHHHHHLQPSPVASSVSPVNQRSPPQPRPQPVVVRLQHPTNHIIAPPSTTKQILVQVPSVVNKLPSSKSSGSSNSSSTKSTVPVLPSKVEPIVPKPSLPPPEQPPAPPPPPSKPVVVKPKVPDRVQKMHMFHQRLLEDQNGAMAADTKNPFTSRRDACQRLLRYHVYNSGLPREEDLHKTDELFAEVSERLLGESRELYHKFHYLMLKEGMRECSSAEKIMIEKLFLEHETDALIAEKRAAEEGQYTTPVEPPPLPPMPGSAWTFEAGPSLPLPRPVKKEPPDSWLDDDDRSDLEPAPKRRLIKEEEHETVMAPMEEETPSLPPVSVTPEHVDLVLRIHKELNMSPSETGEDDEFAHELADFEPPVARFPSSADLKQSQQPQFSSGGNVVPPVVVPDWSCGGKSADSETRAPELDLSGITGLDDDSSGVDPLGRTHYFGEDEEEDKDSVELHDQVQSAINSILDFRRAAEDMLCVDSKGAMVRPEPMDYVVATGSAQPTDSVLDEAVRSILL